MNTTTTFNQTESYSYSKSTSTFNTSNAGYQPTLEAHDGNEDGKACVCCKEVSMTFCFVVVCFAPLMIFSPCFQVFSMFNKPKQCWRCAQGVCAKHLTHSVSVTRSKQSQQICNNCWDEIGDLQQIPVPVPVPVPTLATAHVSMSQQNPTVDDTNVDEDASSVHDYKVHPLAQLFKVAVTMGSFVVSSSAAAANLKRARRNSATPPADNEKTMNVKSPVGPILVVDSTPNPKPSFPGRQTISTLVTSLKRSSRAVASSVAKTVTERRNAFTTGGGSSVAEDSTHDIDPCVVPTAQKATLASPAANALPVAIALDSVDPYDAQLSSHGLRKVFEDASMPRESFSPSRPPVVTVVIETTAMEALKTQGQKDHEELMSLNKRVGDLEGTLKQTNEERLVLAKQLADATAKLPTVSRRDDIVFDVTSAATCFHAFDEEKSGPDAVTVPTPSTTAVRRNAFNTGRPASATQNIMVKNQLPLSSAPLQHHPVSTPAKTFLNRPSIDHAFPPPPAPVQPLVPPPTLSTIAAKAPPPVIDVKIPVIRPATPVQASAAQAGGTRASSAIAVGQAVCGVNNTTTVQSLPVPVQSIPPTTIMAPPARPARPPPIQAPTQDQKPLPDPIVEPSKPTRKSPKAKFNPLWQLPAKRGAKPARYIPPRSPSKKLVAQRVFEYSRGASRGRLPGGGRLLDRTTATTGPTKDAAISAKQ